FSGRTSALTVLQYQSRETFSNGNGDDVLVAQGDACAPGCLQESPHELILPNRFGTGQIERAVQRLSEGHISHGGGDVIRHNGLHQNWWNPNQLPFCRQLGDLADELEEQRGTHARVSNRGSLDQFFLGHLRAEVTADAAGTVAAEAAAAADVVGMKPAAVPGI